MAILEDIKEMLAEQVHYRDLLYQMTRRDLMLRYKQTLMGFGWAIFTPLMNTIVFSVIFTTVAPIDVGIPYPLFAFSGLLAWNFFASSLRFAVGSLTSNYSLVTKVYFPREILPFSALLVCLVDFAVASTALVVLMLYYHVVPTGSLLALPVVLLVHVGFTGAMALLVAMGNLFYRDVKYLFEVVLSVWMFATSVLYPLDTVGGTLGVLARLNPMTAIIDAYRDVLLFGRWPIDAGFVTATFATGLFLAWAWLSFHRAEFSFAENI